METMTVSKFTDHRKEVFSLSKVTFPLPFTHHFHQRPDISWVIILVQDIRFLLKEKNSYLPEVARYFI